ncbi:hypothetical protein [Azospira sp. I09]|jgi:hypothetical protein|uniref:hypothetical protein n=1 Tax=Azospira sp. I09 TaxID=1765049 RepID=UPI00126063D3|nr:hypothetical protein [Azospira sp. I09]BBN87053.1 hypothetical protein AZSP09_00760 [Azospira sp. I09]
MNFRSHISKVGQIVEARRCRKRVQIRTRADLVSNTKKQPGLYWIETNMPASDITEAVKKCSGKTKNVRKTKPQGIGITRSVSGYQIIYSGTESDIQKRLLEHLFNEGADSTEKMSLQIDKPPFAQYDWYISCVHIKDYSTRYALEAWWRLNIGWPPFCKR